MLKPNHSSGEVVFGPAGHTLDSLIDATRGWLESDPARLLGEWGYSQARPLLIVEERIASEGHDLKDYKFFVFDGGPPPHPGQLRTPRGPAVLHVPPCPTGRCCP